MWFSFTKEIEKQKNKWYEFLSILYILLYCYSTLLANISSLYLIFTKFTFQYNKTTHSYLDAYLQTNNEKSISEILEYYVLTNQRNILLNENKNSFKSKRIRYIYSERSYSNDISSPTLSLKKKENLLKPFRKRQTYKEYEIEQDNKSTSVSHLPTSIITVHTDMNQSEESDDKLEANISAIENKPCWLYRSILKK